MEQIEDRLMLSAVVPSVEAQGGFITFSSDDIAALARAYATAGETNVWLFSGTSTATPQGGGMRVRYPTLVPIPREELAVAPSEGGMIDLTRARRELIFDESNRAIQRWTGTENITRASADADEVIAAIPTPTGTEPKINSAIVPRAALPGSPLLNEPIRVSFSVSTLEHIGGSRGRSRAFELAIGFPAATARDEYFTNAGRFPSGHSFRDRLVGPTDSVETTAEVVPSEEPDEKAYPARREDAFDGLHTQGLRSEQKVEPGAATSAGVRAAHHRAVFAQMASTESDVLLPGVFLDKKRSVEVASVLTVVAVGHYLTTRQRQRSDTHPRRMWLPRRRRPL